jgi:hypothetical protein
VQAASCSAAAAVTQLAEPFLTAAASAAVCAQHSLMLCMGAPGEEGAWDFVSRRGQAEPGRAAGEAGEHLLPGKRQLL